MPLGEVVYPYQEFKKRLLPGCQTGRSEFSPMRRFLIAAVAILFGSHNLPLLAQVDPKIHKQCIEAKDYAGCVKAFTTPQQEPDDGLSSLRAAMKQVSARINSGFSLRESTFFFQPVTDQLALASSKYPTAIAVQNASKAANLFNIAQASWQSRINSLKPGYAGIVQYSCEPTKKGVELFNAAAGKEVVTYSVKGGIFGLVLFCQESVGTSHEARMLAYVSELLESGSISPEEISRRERVAKDLEAKAAREKELCAMGPWSRYLEENAGMKKWVEANPIAAEATKKKFLQDPRNQVTCKTDFTKYFLDQVR